MINIEEKKVFQLTGWSVVALDLVLGAVGTVEMALQSLESQNVVKLDEERKAAMANNLLVALVSESEAQAIINTGSLST